MLFLKAEKAVGTRCESKFLAAQTSWGAGHGAALASLGSPRAECSVLCYFTVFVHLLSLIRGSVPDLLALRNNSDVETCEEGANALRAILGPSDVPRQRA